MSPKSIWLVATAATDITIAVMLVWQFLRLRTNFANTKSVIHRLITGALRTGSATSIVALTALSVFLADDQSNLAVGIAYVLGRVYTITMLANLNSRRAISGVGESGDHPSTNSSSQLAARNAVDPESFNMSGIHVIRTVRMDDDVSDFQFMLVTPY